MAELRRKFLRGRKLKYSGKLADDIMEDYRNNVLIKDIMSKYGISVRSLYDVVHRYQDGQ